MKQFKLIGLLTICLMAFANSVSAQKIAYVDTKSIFPAMPEYKKAKSDLEAFAKQLEKVIEEKQLSFLTYQNKLEKDKDITTPIQQKLNMQKLYEMQQNLYKIAQESEIKLANREMELTKPIYQRINAAIEKVAKENDYAYMVAKDTFIYTNGGIDATAKVRTELGLSW